MSDYGFEHHGKVYTPNATADIEPANSEARNREVERQELEWLKTAPDRVFLYVQHPSKELAEKCLTGVGMNARADYAQAWKITTWLGTPVAHRAMIGRQVPTGGIAGRWSHKRSVDCRIFGVRYVGWYYDSSGSYCRLRKAKRQ